MFTRKRNLAIACTAASLLVLSACAGSELSMDEVTLQNYPVRIESALEDMKERTISVSDGTLDSEMEKFDTDCWIALEESLAFFAGPPRNRMWNGNEIGFGVCGPFPRGENESDEWMVADLTLGSYQNDFGGYDYKLFMGYGGTEDTPPVFGEIYSIYGDSAYPNK